MKARFDVSGEYDGATYDFEPFDINFNVACGLSNNDTIIFNGKDGEETEATIKRKVFDSIDNILILECEL